MGRSSKSVDVRSTKDIGNLDKMIMTGPITIVLIYADWCGHCTTFKENVWSKLLKRPRNANLASIHHDQLSKTLLKDAKIRGYPSVLVVGKDGKPAVFREEEEPTNAMPNADLETLEKIANAHADTILRDQDPTASIMSPPDMRENITGKQRPLEGGGNLLKLLKKGAGLSSSATRKRRANKRRTRRV